MPGFVDPHTHVFPRRPAPDCGGGCRATMKDIAAEAAEFSARAGHAQPSEACGAQRRRLAEMLRCGTTTRSKERYGLTTESELRCCT